MDVPRIHSSPTFDFLYEVPGDQFINVILNFYSSKSLQSLSDLTSSVYNFPMIQRDDFLTVVRMRKDGKPIHECCVVLKNYFQFDPALVGGCILRQFTEFDCKLGLQANSIAWFAHYQTLSSDFFSLLITAILNFLLATDDEQSVFLLKELILYYTNKGFTEISSEVFIKTAAFASAKLLFAHDSTEMLVNLLKVAIKLNNDVYTDILLNSLITVIPADTRVDSKSVLQTLEPLFLNFDEIAHDLFIEVTQFNYNDDYYELLERLVSKIIPFLNNISISDIEFKSSQEQDSPIKITDTMNIQPNIFNKLSIGMSLPSPDVLDSRNVYFKIPDDSKELKMFSNLFNKLPENSATGVLSMFAHLMDEEYSSEESRLKIIVFLSHLMKDKDNIPLPDSYVSYLIKCQIFSSTQNVFATIPSEMKKLAALRNDIITCFLSNHPQSIALLLDECSKNVLLFAETIGRIQAHVSFEEMPSFLTNHTIRQITFAIFTLINQIPEEPTEKDKYYRAWSTLFFFVISILEDFKIAELLTINTRFTSLFTTHIFQRKLAPMLKNCYNKFFSSKIIPNLDCVANLVNFASLVFSYATMNKDPYEEVVLDVLEILSTSITHNPGTAQTISAMVPIAFTHLANFPSTSLLQAVLSMVLSISMSIDDFEFTKPQIVQLDEAIKKTEPDGTSEQTQLMLISILAQSKSANTSSMFLIHAPAFIILLLSASSSDLAKIIIFFDKLIKFSIYNCIQCHNGGFDLFIIDMLKNYPNSFSFNGWNFPMNVTAEQIDTVVFPLIRYMFLTKTSLLVVERFVSLAVPSVEGKYPEIADQVITKLNQTLTSAPRLPKLTIAFSNSSPVFDYPNIPIEPFNNGVTFVFQCMFDQALTTLSSAQPILLTIQDQQGNEIIVFANGTTMFCEIRSDGQSSAANLYNNFEPCKWAFCCLILHPRGDSMRVQFSVNGEQPSLFHVRNPNFVGPTLHATVGGFRQNNTELSPFTFFYLGPYMLLDYSFTPTDILRMFSGEILQPEGTNNLIPLQEDWTQESYFHTIKIISERSDFFSCLVPFFKFHQFAPPHFLEKIADILQHIPIESTFNYYPVVANYLYTLPTESLTFTFYSRFVPIGSNLPSTDLLTHILFNVDLWITAPSQHLLRIASHWSSVLASGYISVFKKCYTVSSLLTMMRVYFYYEKIETEIISTRPRSPDLDVAQIRSLMDRLILALAKVQLTQKDVQTLCSHLFTVQDPKQLTDILMTMKALSPLIKNGEKTAYDLHFLFVKTYSQIFVEVLRTIISLSNGNIAPHIELTLFDINKLHINKQTFDAVLEDCRTYPEIFPIAAFIASHLDELQIQAFAVTFSDSVIFPENSNKLTKVKYWYMFPIICAIISPISIPAISAALFAILKNDWHFSKFDEICVFIDRLSFDGYNVREFRSILFNKLVDFALESKSNSLPLNVLMRCARYFLFSFQPILHSNDLTNEYEMSIFGSQKTVLDENKKEMEMLDILNLFKDCSCNLLFRVDPNFDKELLTKVSKLSSLIPQTSFNSTATFYIDFFDYLVKRDSLSENVRNEVMSKLTPLVHQVAMVMNVSYQDFFAKNCKSLFNYLEIELKKVEPLRVISQETVSVSNVACSIYYGSNENNTWTREICTAKFLETHMNESSIWALHKPQMTEKVSHVYTSTFTTPLYKLVGPRPPKRRILTVVGKPLFSCECSIVRMKGEAKSTFALFSDCILFKTLHKEIKYPLKELEFVLHRTRNGKLSCLEFFRIDNRSILIDFFPKSLKSIMPKLSILSQINGCIVQFQLYPIFITKRDSTSDWVNGKKSNFEYLMELNFFGGRTMKWAGAYPILPNVCADKNGNLDDKTTYRDFRRQKHFSIRPNAWLRTFPPFMHLFEDKMPSTSATSCESTGLHFNQTDENKTDESETFSESRFEETEDDFSELEISISDPVELTPEFFTSPDCFPTTNSNVSGFDFVRRMRKALESPFITSQLHLWIDSVFGIDQMQGTKIPQLFSVPHPARNLPRLTLAEKSEKVIKVPCTKIVKGQVESDGNNGYVIRGFSLDIGLFEYRNNVLTVINKSNDPRLVFVPIQNGCVLVNNQDASALVYVNKEKHLISPVPEAHFYGTGSKYGACAGVGGTAYLIDGQIQELFGICHVSPELPTCIYTSGEFKITAVGVKSGSVIFYDFVRGTHIRSIKLGFVPTRIIITKGIGRLVVFGASDFVITSLRGEIIVQTTNTELFGADTTAICSCAVPAYSPYMSEDCIVIADTKRRVFIIDANDGQKLSGEPICVLTSRPVCVCVVEEGFGSFTIFAMGEDGKVVMNSIPSLKL